MKNSDGTGGRPDEMPTRLEKRGGEKELTMGRGELTHLKLRPPCWFNVRKTYGKNRPHTDGFQRKNRKEKWMAGQRGKSKTGLQPRQEERADSEQVRRD